MYSRTGRISCFGGSTDSGVLPDETLALYLHIKCRDLDQRIYTPNYCAMRWDYDIIARNLGCDTLRALRWLRRQAIIVAAHGKTVQCVPADWGPSLSTGRLIDCGPHVLIALAVDTDQLVIVTLPDELALKP